MVSCLANRRFCPFLYVVYSLVGGFAAVAETETVIKVDLTAAPWQISPLIYGLNDWQRDESTEQIGFTLERMGGNRTTSYNWENNFSNAGSDYIHHSDNQLVNITAPENQLDPGLGVQLSVNHAQAGNRPSLVTLQLAGYVAADGNGTVSESDTAPSDRWKEVLVRKGAPLSLTPDTTDDFVYLDEQVNFLIETYGTAEAGGVFAYSMDNEPGLWGYTHERIHPAQPTADEVISKNAAGAAMVKELDPSALVFGPALYGWGAYEDFQDAPDWGDFEDDYDWFVSAYLGEMRHLSETAGMRLLDVLDLHYYPEVAVVTGQDGSGNNIYTRITDNVNNDAALTEARLQAPRSLWDDTYVEESWVTQWSTGGESLEVLPKVFSSIATHYPETKLGISEYDFGGHQNFSGGLAQVDVLGILGRDQVYAACFWGEVSEFIIPAFQLFRNYDGEGAQFGDIGLATENPDAELFSSYAALNSQTGSLQVILINKSESPQLIRLDFLGFSGEFQNLNAFGFSEATGPVLDEISDLPSYLGSQPSLTLPARSANLFVFEISQQSTSEAQLRIVETATKGSFTITVPTQLGVAYQLQESRDLENWSDVGSVFWGTGLDRTISEDGVEGKRFWKVIPVIASD